MTAPHLSNPTSNPAEFDRTSFAPPSPQARLYPLSDALADLRADAAAAYEACVSGKPPGAITGLASLDRELSGHLVPGLHFVHGQPGAGKTAFVLQLAASCQCPALLVTCEMSPAELLRRHTARTTGTFLGRLKNGEMRPEDAEALARRAIEAAPLLAFVDATQGAARPFPSLYAKPDERDFNLFNAARVVKRDAPHLLIVVDSLHSWSEGLASGVQEYEALNSAVADLRGLAHALRCPVLVVSERNRDSMKTGGMNAGAGTRKIEYGAETVIDLERDPAKREDGAGEVEVLLKLAKNRHGAAGKTVPLKFNGALQSFRELDTAESCEAALHANQARMAAKARP
jgi:replicative DNA helicase